MASPLVKRFLISLDRNKWLGLLTFAVVLAGSVGIAYMPESPPPAPTYTARGRFALSELPPAFTSTGTQLQQASRTITQDLLLSQVVLQRVAEQLRLTPEQIVKIVRDKKLNFPSFENEEENQQPSSPYIVVEYTDPKSGSNAQLFLEVYMNAVVQNSRLVNSAQLRTRIQELNQRLVKVKRDLAASEGAFYRYISTEGSSLLAVQDGSLLSGITNSQQQQRELQLGLDEVEGQINSLSKQLGLSADQAYTSSALSADPIIANLRASILQTELELDRLSKDLRPEHPTVVQLRKQLAVDENQLQKRAQEVIGNDGLLSKFSSSQVRQNSNLDPARRDLANQLVVLRTQREGLLRQMNSLKKTEQELRQQFEQFPTKQLEQARLVQEVESQRILYQTILTALTDARAAEAETVGSVAIESPPQVFQPPVVAILPKNKVLIISLGAVVGVVAAAGVIFFLAMADDKLYSSEEIQETLTARDVPLLGELPFVFNITETGEANPVLIDADATYLQFYERFRSNLRRLGLDSSKMVIVTSTVNEEGKSVTAYNLAIASAHAGKRTLLVEADLRQPAKVKWLQIEPNPEAKQEPLRYYAARNDAITLVPEVENLYVVPSPGPQRQAAALIESSELKLLLKDVRGRFDMVVIDTPSLARCNDALLLERLTEGTVGVVLVTRPGVTQKSLLGEAVEQFIEAEVPLLGAVINGVEELGLFSELPIEMVEPELELQQAAAI